MKLWSSYLKELKLSSKGFYFYVEVFMTLIILIVILFVIPEDYSSTQEQYISLDVPETVEEFYINEIEEQDIDGKAEVVEFELDDEIITADFYEWEGQEVYIIDNEADMIALTEEERPLVGTVLTWDADSNRVVYDYYIQGYESDRLKNLYKIINNDNIEVIAQNAEEIEIVSLEENHETLNTRQMSVPALITFNGSLMGMFIMAAYIFLDKGEGVIKAYAVTPSKIWHYLMSKALTLITVTIITTLIIVIPVMGFQPAYWAMLILLVTSAFFSSALGLLISSFFDNMNQAFGTIYIFMMLFMLPAIAYFIPSWNPVWIQVIPVYYLIMAFKETVLENGDMVFVMVTSAAFLVVGIVLFLFANKKFKKSLAF